MPFSGSPQQQPPANQPSSNADHSMLGVKATDDNHDDCVTQNSDHAGTPELYKSNVIGGSRRRRLQLHRFA